MQREARGKMVREEVGVEFGDGPGGGGKVRVGLGGLGAEEVSSVCEALAVCIVDDDQVVCGAGMDGWGVCEQVEENCGKGEREPVEWYGRRFGGEVVE